MKLLETIYLRIYSETEIAKQLQRETSDKVTELAKKYSDGISGNAEMEDAFNEAAHYGLKCGFLTGIRFVADILMEIYEAKEDIDGIL